MQKSEQRMRCTGSERKAEAVPFNSFDLLRNFFIVEATRQTNKIIEVAQREKLVDFQTSNNPNEVISFEGSRTRNARVEVTQSNFPLSRLAKSQIEKQIDFLCSIKGAMGKMKNEIA